MSACLTSRTTLLKISYSSALACGGSFMTPFTAEGRRTRSGSSVSHEISAGKTDEVGDGAGLGVERGTDSPTSPATPPSPRLSLASRSAPSDRAAPVSDPAVEGGAATSDGVGGDAGEDGVSVLGRGAAPSPLCFPARRGAIGGESARATRDASPRTASSPTRSGSVAWLLLATSCSAWTNPSTLRATASKVESEVHEAVPVACRMYPPNPLGGRQTTVSNTRSPTSALI